MHSFGRKFLIFLVLHVFKIGGKVISNSQDTFIVLFTGFADYKKIIRKKFHLLDVLCLKITLFDMKQKNEIQEPKVLKIHIELDTTKRY